MATNFFDITPQQVPPTDPVITGPPVADVLERAVAELMSDKARSGSFEIADELVDQSGSYGAAIDAIVMRARRLSATVSIEFEPQVRYRSFVKDNLVITYLNVTVNWSK